MHLSSMFEFTKYNRVHQMLVFGSSTPHHINRPQILAMADGENRADPTSNHVRRTANYKPNIWKHDRLQSLPAEFSKKERYTMRIRELREEVAFLFVEAKSPLSKLELVDCVSKLGLDKYFQQEIEEALDMASLLDKNDDLYSTALRFRLLRHYGRSASQEMFISFIDEAGKFKMSGDTNLKTLIELFEASNMAREGENILKEAMIFSIERLNSHGVISDSNEAETVSHAMMLPWQQRVEWYNVRKNISICEKLGHRRNHKLVELSKLNFNLIQSSHQEDLKDASRWWIDLGIKGKISFSRDRVVESFLFAAGIAPEAQHGSLRKWLTKSIKLILIVDDVYDIYGSLEELECFTNAVEMWNPEKVKHLPEGIQICFRTLLNTIEQMETEIEREKGWTSVLPHLRKTWIDFCKSLMLEAKWYNKGYNPSLEEYLENGWVSSSGGILALLVILGVGDWMKGNVEKHLKDCQDIIFHASMIIRLANDQETSAAELERGDATSSILCYMREANVSEEVAREHIKSFIMKTWRNINSHSAKTRPFLEEPVRYIVNIARTAHFIYQHGDGFGVQDGHTGKQVLFNLIKPLNVEP